MAYVDGFVIPVPHGNREAYLKVAKAMAPLFLENGALQVVECWGDDVPEGKRTDFRRAVAAEAGESVVFSWILWPSKEVRDAASPRVMADPRMSAVEMPFDGKRMIFGGFAVLHDTKGGEE